MKHEFTIHLLVVAIVAFSVTLSGCTSTPRDRPVASISTSLSLYEVEVARINFSDASSKASSLGYSSGNGSTANITYYDFYKMENNTERIALDIAVFRNKIDCYYTPDSVFPESNLV